MQRHPEHLPVQSFPSAHPACPPLDQSELLCWNLINQLSVQCSKITQHTGAVFADLQRFSSYSSSFSIMLINCTFSSTLCCSFAVNICHNEQDITMHLNARFNAHGDENKVVCNSYQGGKWCEEVREGGFPFRQGEEFQVSPEPAELGEALKRISHILSASSSFCSRWSSNSPLQSSW